jgi:hypothetical protein
MALPDSLTAELGTLLSGSWSQIIADANANSGRTNLSFTIVLTEVTPEGGPVNYDISFTHRFRAEISQSQFERVTGTAS